MENNALDLKKPNFKKKLANIHYESEATQEFGTIVIRANTTIEDVFRQYCRFFPKEAKLFKKEIEFKNQILLKKSGISAGGRMMALGSVPEVIMTACKFLYGEDYWDDKKNSIQFFRDNPGLMVGEHSVRS